LIFFGGDNFRSISSNFRPLSDFVEYNTHKKRLQSTSNPQKRENIRKGGTEGIDFFAAGLAGKHTKPFSTAVRTSDPRKSTLWIVAV
jgi:hypothetical protein